jgi:hypothetical protein
MSKDKSPAAREHHNAVRELVAHDLADDASPLVKAALALVKADAGESTTSRELYDIHAAIVAALADELL